MQLCIFAAILSNRLLPLLFIILPLVGRVCDSLIKVNSRFTVFAIDSPNIITVTKGLRRAFSFACINCI